MYATVLLTMDISEKYILLELTKWAEIVEMLKKNTSGWLYTWTVVDHWPPQTVTHASVTAVTGWSCTNTNIYECMAAIVANDVYISVELEWSSMVYVPYVSIYLYNEQLMDTLLT